MTGGTSTPLRLMTNAELRDELIRACDWSDEEVALIVKDELLNRGDGEPMPREEIHAACYQAYGQYMSFHRNLQAGWPPDYAGLWRSSYLEKSHR